MTKRHDSKPVPFGGSIDPDNLATQPAISLNRDSASTLSGDVPQPSVTIDYTASKRRISQVPGYDPAQDIPKLNFNADSPNDEVYQGPENFATFPWEEEVGTATAPIDINTFAAVSKVHSGQRHPKTPSSNDDFATEPHHRNPHRHLESGPDTEPNTPIPSHQPAEQRHHLSVEPKTQPLAAHSSPAPYYRNDPVQPPPHPQHTPPSRIGSDRHDPKRHLSPQMRPAPYQQPTQSPIISSNHDEPHHHSDLPDPPHQRPPFRTYSSDQFKIDAPPPQLVQNYGRLPLPKLTKGRFTQPKIKLDDGSLNQWEKEAFDNSPIVPLLFLAGATICALLGILAYLIV